MRPQYLVTLLVLLALAGASAPTPALAGGVVSVCDEAHLLTALAGGGTVTFSCSGTIILTAEIVISTDTTIDGSGQNVTISGNHKVRVFTVNEGVTLSLNELAVAAGHNNDYGGGILSKGGTVTVNNSTLYDSSAGLEGGGRGGGIYNSFGTLNVGNSALSRNSAADGGSIYSTGAVTVSNSTFSSNSAVYGASIYGFGTLAVSNSTFSGNIAGNGGGIYNEYSTTVSNSTFSGNTIFYDGGGIYSKGTLTVSNSTFSGNSAGWNGGGIYSFGTLAVSNSTFSGNSAGNGGGIYNALDLVPLQLQNTIVANSPAGGNCSGAITDGGGNLSYPDTTCPGINSDPKLGPLQNNLGPTHTMVLLPGSAAIDAGVDTICVAPPVNSRDQRGIARPQGPHCDIGAYEATLQPILPRAFLPIILR